MITLKDIADRLDFSTSTVGRALADHPRISRKTKELVRATANELGYVANRAAQVMRGGSSHLVGLLVPDVRSTFYSMVAQNLSKCFESNGFHLALSINDDDREKELAQVRELVSARVAGIALVPTAAPKRETLKLLRTVPHVQILRQIPALGDWFGMDEESAILGATNHLLELGHRRIGYVGDVMFPTGKVRYAAFCRAMSEAKLKVDKSLVELGNPNRQFGAEAVSRLVASRPGPTAIMVTSVQTTLGAAEQLAAELVEVPRSVSMIGYGDGDWHQWWGPGLTTLRLPVEDLATTCGLWFLNSLQTSRWSLSKEPHISMSSISLVKRGSTAPPPGAALRIQAGKRPPTQP
jgi:LacI family transcriptional regulator, repressor for deo operon, udp, cdd, tsx, nupC, and nupG